MILELAENKEIDEANVLKNILSGASNKDGMSLGEMRVGLKVLDKLDTHLNKRGVGYNTRDFELDDDELKFLQKRYKGTKFMVVSRELVALADKLGV